MPKMLKDQMRERLDATALEMYGVENFTDMIADETICTEDPEALLEYLGNVGHPVLGMEPFDM
jgi:acetyl-CoA synthase